MVANILPTDTPLTQGWGQRVKPYIFVKVVMLHIKFKSTMKAYILSLHTPTTPGWGQKVKFYLRRLSESRSGSGSTPSVHLSVCLCLVCVICNSNSFHSFIFKLFLVIFQNITDLHFLFFTHLINIFSFFKGVELRHFFHPKCVGGFRFVLSVIIPLY